MNILDEIIRDLSVVQNQLEHCEKKGDAKRVASLVKLMKGYNAGDCLINNLGEILSSRKKKTKTSKKKVINPEELKKSAENIVIAFRQRDIDRLKEELAKRFTTVPV